MSKGGTKTKTTKEAPSYVSNQMRRTFQNAETFKPEVYQGNRVAELAPDQMAFFDRAREYADTALSRDMPEIDTSAIEAQMGRSVDTSGVAALMGQRIDAGRLEGMIGDRADTALLNQAHMASTDTGLLGSLMGQGNAANAILTDHTTREVTPYLETAVNDATDRALQNVNSLYASAGRLGSGAFADAAARGVTNAAAPILQQAAQTDAARQLAAAQTLAQTSAQDMSRDTSIADAMTGYGAADLSRRGQLAGVLANLEEAGMARDAGIANSLAGYQAQDLARDMSASQSMMAAHQADLARDAGLANQLANLSAEQARLAPTMQQMDMQALGLLGTIGDAQQNQRQAAINAELQRVAESNAANQARLSNMYQVQGLGQGYMGQSTDNSQYVTPWGVAVGAGSTLLGGLMQGMAK